MRCEVCYDLRPAALGGLQAGQRAIHFIEVGELRRSDKQRGCTICRMLFQALRTRKLQWNEEDDRSPIELRIGTGIPLQLFYRRDAIYLEVFSSESDRSGIPDTIGTATMVSEYSGSRQALTLLKKWMAECTGSHKDAVKQYPYGCRLACWMSKVCFDVELGTWRDWNKIGIIHGIELLLGRFQ